MAFQPVTSNATDIKESPNTDFVGYYLDSRQIVTKVGPQVIYKFENKDGEIFNVYGFTNLNRAMENVKVGTLTKLRYLGTKKVDTKYGKNKDVHQVAVEIDTEDTKEIPF